MSALPLTRRSATLECLLRARDLGLDRSEPLLVLGALLLGFFACLVNRLGDEGVARYMSASWAITASSRSWLSSVL
jgi:hypothetical protein